MKKGRRKKERKKKKKTQGKEESRKKKKKREARGGGRRKLTGERKERGRIKLMEKKRFGWVLKNMGAGRSLLQ